MSPHDAPQAPGAPEAAEAAVAAIDRPADLRLTRLHLRMGSLELARAELEAFAGAGELDTDALIDLAEVRWRTGDLPGAGVAANAYLAADRDDTLAVVIAAEASAAAGHPGEARQHVARVLGREGIDLDAVFAGMPRSWMWPLEPTEEPVATSALFPGATRPMADATALSTSASASVPATATIAATAAAGTTAPAESTAAATAETPQPGPFALEASPAASLVAAQAATSLGSSPIQAGELEAARSALAAGDAEAAADRLGDLLRARPDLAPSILDALERAAAPGSASDQGVAPTDAAGDRPRDDAPRASQPDDASPDDRPR